MESLGEQKYRLIICYPIYRPEELEHRLKELRELGVEALVFFGKKRVCDMAVLGKGYVGIVLVAYRDGEKVALKVRRTDAERSTMRHEAQMLQKANGVDVGPRLLGVTEDFLLMEYIEGVLFPEWVEALKGKEMKNRLRRFLHMLLEQAWSLDEAGLDHGELSHAPKHIIVKANDAPCLVDFEAASVSRRVSNVTSLSQYLFIGSPDARIIQKKLGGIAIDGLLDTLKRYKRRRNRESFADLLYECKIVGKS